MTKDCDLGFHHLAAFDASIFGIRHSPNAAVRYATDMPQLGAELDGLKQQLLLMASHAESAVNHAMRAMLRRDDDLARRIPEEDTVIDHLEMEIERKVLDLLGRV